MNQLHSPCCHRARCLLTSICSPRMTSRKERTSTGHDAPHIMIRTMMDTHLWRHPRVQLAQGHERGVEGVVVQVVEEALALAQAGGVVGSQAVCEGHRASRDQRLVDRDSDFPA